MDIINKKFICVYDFRFNVTGPPTIYNKMDPNTFDVGMNFEAELINICFYEMFFYSVDNDIYLLKVLNKETRRKDHLLKMYFTLSAVEEKQINIHIIVKDFLSEVLQKPRSLIYLENLKDIVKETSGLKDINVYAMSINPHEDDCPHLLREVFDLEIGSYKCMQELLLKMNNTEMVGSKQFMDDLIKNHKKI